MKMYHNPECSKCKNALALLEEKGIVPEIIKYLETPPSADELKKVVKKLGIAPLDLVRKKERIFKESYFGKELSDDEWIEVLITHPILIERPIVIEGNRAIIGRPPVKVLDLL
jgi:arsenate reductase